MKQFKSIICFFFFLSINYNVSGQASINILLEPYVDSLDNHLLLVKYQAQGGDFIDFNSYWKNQSFTIGWKTTCGVSSNAPKPSSDVKILPNTFNFKGIFSKGDHPIIFKPSDIGSIDDGYVYASFFAEIEKPIQVEMSKDEEITAVVIDIPDEWELSDSSCIFVRIKPFFDKEGKEIPYAFYPVLNNAGIGSNVWNRNPISNIK